MNGRVCGWKSLLIDDLTSEVKGLLTDPGQNAVGVERSVTDRHRRGKASFRAGGDFGLVDAAFAPFFLRARLLNATFPSLGSPPSGLRPWADALLARRSVTASVPEHFDTGYPGFLRAKGSWLLREA